jgi:hypothetical protein
MPTVAHSQKSMSANTRSGASQVMDDAKRPFQNSRDQGSDSSPATTQASTPAVAPSNSKKGKAKKAADPTDASKQIAAKIAQLEQDAAGEKDQEAEIGNVFHATRQLCSFVHSYIII